MDAPATHYQLLLVFECLLELAKHQTCSFPPALHALAKSLGIAGH